ncbi:MAG: sigma-70 family RNA polymerase sigma factor [Syntrophomonas sp.]
MTTITNLIEKARAGSLDAFGEMVSQYQDRVYSHCRFLSGNPDDAQDLAQDVFVQAFKGIKSFRNDADFGTWLHRIAVNQWINYQRKNKKGMIFSLDEPLHTKDGEVYRELAASEENISDIIEQSELREILVKALDSLLPEFKAALILRDIEGYDYQEIAKLLGCSLGTVKSRINRGRKALKKKLAALGVE